MSIINVKTIKEALGYKKSKNFWVSYDDGRSESGNIDSFYKNILPDENLTFDVSNNKMLANVSLNGSIKFISSYRGCYRTNSDPTAWPGVWLYKDFSKWGPYSFSLQIGNQEYELLDCKWPVRTYLLDNLFPVTELIGEKIKITLIVFAPVSNDGQIIPRGIVYGALIENVSSDKLSGHIKLPELYSNKNSTRRYGLEDGLPFTHEMDMGFADVSEKTSQIAFELCPDEYLWVPAVLYVPGESTLEEINTLGSIGWLNETWNYYKKMLGSFQMPSDSYSEEFIQRCVHQCYASIGMDGQGKISGSNWGSYPTTNQIWMKDMYYSFLPLCIFEPKLFKAGILWFYDYSIRHSGITFKGGVVHSLSNALSPIIMSGLYYSTTDDKDFFLSNSWIMEKSKRILNEMIESRQDNSVWLFPSDLISDGDAVGDYHTGTNVCAWYALNSFARILEQVFLDKDGAESYRMIAKRVKDCLESYNIIDGPFGKQYIEGVNRDKTIPHMYHEAEESDTTLMPFYGYQTYDDTAYKNYTKFAMTTHNIGYSVITKGIRWGMHVDSIYVDASFPGYATGFSNVVDAETMNGESGYLTEIKRLTDVDGSIWWWPYPKDSSYGQVKRNNVCGKCAWASGVIVCQYINDILGIRYDAPLKTLFFKPFSPSGSFEWKDFRYGSGLFDVSYQKTSQGIEVRVRNKNRHLINIKLEVMIEEGMHLSSLMNTGLLTTDELTIGKFLGKRTESIQTTLLYCEERTFLWNVG